MDQSFWERSARDVAASLPGFVLHVGGKEAVIFHATPFECDEQQRGLYKPMLDMEGGQVYCPKFMASVLLLIATGKGKTKGGCVRIDDIELDGVRFEGPGRVTSALGIVTANARGLAQIVDNACVDVLLDTHSPQPRRNASVKQPQRERGISETVLAKYRKLIVKKYLAENHRITFQEYLNLLLETCTTEAELSKRVRL